MTGDDWLLVLGVLLLVATLGTWAWWARSRLRRRSRLRSWPRVAAHVAEVRTTQERVTVQDQSQSYVVRSVRYEFTDSLGARRDGAGKARSRVEAGDRIEVMHDPDDSSRHELVVGAPLWADLTLLVLLTLLPLGAGILTLLLGLGYE